MILWWVGGLLAATTAAGAQAPGLDTAAAASGLRELGRACHADAGRLWGRTLCGPAVLVDLQHRAIVANEGDPRGRLHPWNDAFVGAWLDSIGAANTAITWAGRRWATVRLPLPSDRFDRLTLILHESFHRVQPALGLSAADAPNPQLDDRDGRYWLRLELGALRAAILAKDRTVARQHARDAVLFRAERYRRYPGADSTERLLELQEGLAEYTGERLAMTAGAGNLARVAQHLVDWQQTPTYTRSFAYATGPALGFVLDRFDPRWRSQVVRTRDLGGLLRRAVGIGAGSVHDRAVAAAAQYDGAAIAGEEDARDRDRQQRLREYRARYVEGPVLTLRQNGLSRAFNPNNLQAFPDQGTVYPTGVFASTWGKLTVDSVGALVATDYSWIRVAAPADTAARPIIGRGWTLELAPGWTIAPGARPGDLEIVARPNAP